MLTVHLAGLVFFDACQGGCEIGRDKDKKILIPDGTKGDTGLPPHFTSLWVEADRYDSDSWWPEAKFAHALEVTENDGTLNNVFVLEFRIPEPAVVTFPDDKDPLKTVNLDKGLPRLQATEGFKLDERHPDAIATIPLRGGTIEPRSFCEVAVVQWTIPNNSGDTIIATTRSGEERTLQLRNPRTLKATPALRELGVEVVVSNGPDLVAARSRSREHAGCDCDHHDAHEHGDGNGHTHDAGNGQSAHHGNHFALYGKLDEKRNGEQLIPGLKERLREAEKDRSPLDFNHGFLRFLLSGNEIPNNQCTGSCC